MKCPNCNKLIDNDSNFCEYCGSAIKNIDNNNDNNVSLKLRVLQYLFVIWLLLIIVLWIITYSLFDYVIVSLLTLFYIISVSWFFYIKKKEYLNEFINRFLFIVFFSLIICLVPPICIFCW